MKPLWLMGGLGLGLGLMYMLDPERGERRRDSLRAQLATYGRQTENFLDDTTRNLGQQMQTLLAKTPMPRMPRRHQPGLGEKLLAPVEQIGVTTGLLMLGCVGLGVGLTYMLEPDAGEKRRALVRDKARTYWHKTDHFLRSAAREVNTQTASLMGKETPAVQKD